VEISRTRANGNPEIRRAGFSFNRLQALYSFRRAGMTGFFTHQVKFKMYGSFTKLSSALPNELIIKAVSSARRAGDAASTVFNKNRSIISIRFSTSFSPLKTVG
jgi:hypothetical protein